MPRKKSHTGDKEDEDSGRHLSQDPDTMAGAMFSLFRDFTPAASVFL